MELIDALLNVDQHLALFIEKYGIWIYALLFFIIFAETGFVVTPFLPGDSLLFAIGALSASGQLDIKIVVPLLFLAAVTGNMINYYIGFLVGPKIFKRENVKFLNRRNLDRTNEFYEKHGGKAIVLSRFLPILRTFIPFIAGIGKMDFLGFMGFNIIGGTLWILAFTFGGYFFGNIPLVKQNFELVIVGILIVSLLPTIVEYVKYKKQANTRGQQES